MAYFVSFSRYFLRVTVNLLSGKMYYRLAKSRPLRIICVSVEVQILLDSTYGKVSIVHNISV